MSLATLAPASMPLWRRQRSISPEVVGTFQSPVSWVLSRFYDIHVHDRHHLPARGRVILAPNHVGTLDGPLAIFTSGRPTFALAKNELFSGIVGQALHLSGQIPLARDYADAPAMRRAVGVLEDEQALAIFPEGARGAGDFATVYGGVTYLAAITGAPIVPCALFGTRLRGAPRKANPPLGSRLDVVYGQPFHIPQVAWPRQREVLAPLHQEVTARLRGHVQHAQQLTGCELPGPLPLV